MSKRIVMVVILLTMLVSFAGLYASADDVFIDTAGATPFVYGGRSYIPLKSAAHFLGAPLRWDSAQNRVVMDYNGKELVLTPGSRNALFEGQPVVLSTAPRIGNGRLFVPIDALKQTYGVPVEWDKAHSRVRLKSTTGWGVVTVRHSPPPGWYHGRKTGWGKHGDATRPPGLSKKQNPRSVIVVPNAKVKSQKTENGKGAGLRGTPTPPEKGMARGRQDK